MCGLTPSLLPALFMKYGQVRVANQHSPHCCCWFLSIQFLLSFFSLCIFVWPYLYLCLSVSVSVCLRVFVFCVCVGGQSLGVFLSVWVCLWEYVCEYGIKYLTSYIGCRLQECLHTVEKGVSDWKHRIKNTVRPRAGNRKTQKEWKKWGEVSGHGSPWLQS